MKAFAANRKLKHHLQSHPAGHSHYCSFCKNVHIPSSNYQHHFERNHANPMPHNCWKRKYIFVHQTCIDNHNWYIHKYSNSVEFILQFFPVIMAEINLLMLIISGQPKTKSPGAVLLSVRKPHHTTTLGIITFQAALV